MGMNIGYVYFKLFNHIPLIGNKSGTSLLSAIFCGADTAFTLTSDNQCSFKGMFNAHDYRIHNPNSTVLRSWDGY
jgi:hypothetical protein